MEKQDEEPVERQKWRPTVRKNVHRNLVTFLRDREHGVLPGHHSSCHAPVSDAATLLAEEKATLPTQNKACELSRQCRATFLCAFSQDGKYVASTHGDHTVRVSNVVTGRCEHILTGHPRTPWCISFHPNRAELLATGCLGGHVNIWDLRGGGREVWIAEEGNVITSLTFHPSEQLLVIAHNNQLVFWDWEKTEPLAVCKTSCEFERIRWVKFDNLGQFLYTGIANVEQVDDEQISADLHESDRSGHLITPPSLYVTLTTDQIEERSGRFEFEEARERERRRLNNIRFEELVRLHDSRQPSAETRLGVSEAWQTTGSQARPTISFISSQVMSRPRPSVWSETRRSSVGSETARPTLSQMSAMARQSLSATVRPTVSETARRTGLETTWPTGSETTRPSLFTSAHEALDELQEASRSSRRSTEATRRRRLDEAAVAARRRRQRFTTVLDGGTNVADVLSRDREALNDLSAQAAQSLEEARAYASQITRLRSSTPTTSISTSTSGPCPTPSTSSRLAAIRDQLFEPAPPLDQANRLSCRLFTSVDQQQQGTSSSPAVGDFPDLIDPPPFLDAEDLEELSLPVTAGPNNTNDTGILRGTPISLPVHTADSTSRQQNQQQSQQQSQQAQSLVSPPYVIHPSTASASANESQQQDPQATPMSTLIDEALNGNEVEDMAVVIDSDQEDELIVAVVDSDQEAIVDSDGHGQEEVVADRNVSSSPAQPSSNLVSSLPTRNLPSSSLLTGSVNDFWFPRSSVVPSTSSSVLPNPSTSSTPCVVPLHARRLYRFSSAQNSMVPTSQALFSLSSSSSSCSNASSISSTVYRPSVTSPTSNLPTRRRTYVSPSSQPFNLPLRSSVRSQPYTISSRPSSSSSSNPSVSFNRHSTSSTNRPSYNPPPPSSGSCSIAMLIQAASHIRNKEEEEQRRRDEQQQRRIEEEPPQREEQHREEERRSEEEEQTLGELKQHRANEREQNRTHQFGDCNSDVPKDKKRRLTLWYGRQQKSEEQSGDQQELEESSDDTAASGNQPERSTDDVAASGNQPERSTDDVAASENQQERSSDDAAVTREQTGNQPDSITDDALQNETHQGSLENTHSGMEANPPQHPSPEEEETLECLPSVTSDVSFHYIARSRHVMEGQWAGRDIRDRQMGVRQFAARYHPYLRCTPATTTTAVTTSSTSSSSNSNRNIQVSEISSSGITSSVSHIGRPSESAISAINSLLPAPQPSPDAMAASSHGVFLRRNLLGRTPNVTTSITTSTSPPSFSFAVSSTATSYASGCITSSTAATFSSSMRESTSSVTSTAPTTYPYAISSISFGNSQGRSLLNELSVEALITQAPSAGSSSEILPILQGAEERMEEGGGEHIEGSHLFDIYAADGLDMDDANNNPPEATNNNDNNMADAYNRPHTPHTPPPPPRAAIPTTPPIPATREHENNRINQTERQQQSAALSETNPETEAAHDRNLLNDHTYSSPTSDTFSNSLDVLSSVSNMFAYTSVLGSSSNAGPSVGSSSNVGPSVVRSDVSSSNAGPSVGSSLNAGPSEGSSSTASTSIGSSSTAGASIGSLFNVGTTSNPSALHRLPPVVLDTRPIRRPSPDMLPTRATLPALSNPATAQRMLVDELELPRTSSSIESSAAVVELAHHLPRQSYRPRLWTTAPNTRHLSFNESLTSSPTLTTTPVVTSSVRSIDLRAAIPPMRMMTTTTNSSSRNSSPATTTSSSLQSRDPDRIALAEGDPRYANWPQALLPPYSRSGLRRRIMSELRQREERFRRRRDQLANTLSQQRAAGTASTPSTMSRVRNALALSSNSNTTRDEATTSGLDDDSLQDSIAAVDDMTSQYASLLRSQSRSPASTPAPVSPLTVSPPSSPPSLSIMGISQQMESRIQELDERVSDIRRRLTEHLRQYELEVPNGYPTRPEYEERGAQEEPNEEEETMGPTHILRHFQRRMESDGPPGTARDPQTRHEELRARMLALRNREDDSETSAGNRVRDPQTRHEEIRARILALRNREDDSETSAGNTGGMSLNVTERMRETMREYRDTRRHLRRSPFRAHLSPFRHSSDHNDRGSSGSGRGYRVGNSARWENGRGRDRNTLRDRNIPSDDIRARILSNHQQRNAFVTVSEADTRLDSNVTYRIQRWDMERSVPLPQLTIRDQNIVVSRCKIHNDATVEMSADNRLLVAICPHPSNEMDHQINVFSLAENNLGQCLFSKTFGPSAISVSLSPLNNYLLVGLASRRGLHGITVKQMVAQVYQLNMEKLDNKNAGEEDEEDDDHDDSIEHVCDLLHTAEDSMAGGRMYVSVNSARWLPTLGSGIIYGTNRGDLNICFPGCDEQARQAQLRREHEVAMTTRNPLNPRRSGTWGAPGTITISTQTQGVRRSASTQTDSTGAGTSNAAT